MTDLKRAEELLAVPDEEAMDRMFLDHPTPADLEARERNWKIISEHMNKPQPDMNKNTLYEPGFSKGFMLGLIVGVAAGLLISAIGLVLFLNNYSR